MFKSLNSRVLWIILILAIVAIAVVYYKDNQQGGRTFKDILVAVDPQEVTAISLYPAVQEGREIRFSKEADGWKILLMEQAVDADSAKVNQLLASFRQLKPQRLAATNADKWKDFQVDDSSGTRLSLYAGERILADVVVGKFAFNQSTRTGMTYVRKNHEVPVYAVEGFLSMEVNQKTDYWIAINKDIQEEETREESLPQ